MERVGFWLATMCLFWVESTRGADDFPKPYSPPCVEREDVFEFTEKPAVKNLGNDKYEITFAAKGSCDVTVGILLRPEGYGGQVGGQ